MVFVVVTVFIVVALVVRWSLLVSQDVYVTAFGAPGTLEPCGSYIVHCFSSVSRTNFTYVVWSFCQRFSADHTILEWS